MTGLGQTEKDKKNSLRYYFCPKQVGEFLKKIKKKKKKTFILALFLAELGWDRP